MIKKVVVAGVAAIAIISQTFISAPTASAKPVVTPIIAGSRVAPAPARFTTADYIQMAKRLRVSDTPRTVIQVDGLEVLTYDFDGQVSMQIAYKNGEPVVPTQQSTLKPGSKVRPMVKFGAVWWSVWVQLNSAEQAALAAGAAGTVMAALTKNPATVGIATTVVAVATANGICSRGRSLRIYIPSFLMTECI